MTLRDWWLKGSHAEKEPADIIRDAVNAWVAQQEGLTRLAGMFLTSRIDRMLGVQLAIPGLLVNDFIASAAKTPAYFEAMEDFWTWTPAANPMDENMGTWARLLPSAERMRVFKDFCIQQAKGEQTHPVEGMLAWDELEEKYPDVAKIISDRYGEPEGDEGEEEESEETEEKEEQE